MQVIAAAVAGTTWDRIRQIPAEFWIRLGTGVIVVIVTIILLRKVAKMNKVVLSVIVGLLVTVVGFNWIYERNEPKWATPAVGFLSGFLPTKGKVEQKKSGL
jgi:hypothetical protein